VIVLGPRHWKLGRASAWKKLGLAWEPERERTGAWSLRTRTRCCWVLNKYSVPGYHIAILYIYYIYIYIDFFMKLSGYGSAETDFVVDRTAWNTDLYLDAKFKIPKLSHRMRI